LIITLLAVTRSAHFTFYTTKPVSN